MKIPRKAAEPFMSVRVAFWRVKLRKALDLPNWNASTSVSRSKRRSRECEAKAFPRSRESSVSNSAPTADEQEKPSLDEARPAPNEAVASGAPRESGEPRSHRN